MQLLYVFILYSRAEFRMVRHARSTYRHEQLRLGCNCNRIDGCDDSERLFTPASGRSARPCQRRFERSRCCRRWSEEPVPDGSPSCCSGNRVRKADQSMSHAFFNFLFLYIFLRNSGGQTDGWHPSPAPITPSVSLSESVASDPVCADKRSISMTPWATEGCSARPVAC